MDRILHCGGREIDMDKQDDKGLKKNYPVYPEYPCY